ncbi:MAG TPA: hypothetical protein VIQ03_15245 [Gammaproteobacteria bacterium]
MKSIIALVISALFITSYSQAAEWRGNISGQLRYFLHEPLAQNTEQHNNYLSISAQPEFYHSWDNDDQSITATPFVRIDQYDNERSHADIRELVWRNTFEDWQLKAGISKVYWGVTESQHLVDVINQTDLVENIDGEDKLGQPMIQANIERDWGNIDLFILPGFRERTFADIEGRPRTYPYVDTDQAQYESSDKDRHIDYAVRFFKYLGEWEIGLSYFDGTSREPIFNTGTKNSQLVLIPYYPLMQQAGISAQATTEEWLWKLEIIQRNWIAEDYVALTGGLEYTFVGVFDSNADIGWVAEYLYDNRDENATSFFENDVMIGLRLAMNDMQSTEALLGIIVDMDSNESLISLEASRRLGNNWKLEVELRMFQHVDTNNLMSHLRKDDFIVMEMGYYF